VSIRLAVSYTTHNTDGAARPTRARGATSVFSERARNDAAFAERADGTHAMQIFVKTRA
jgi:hypothetical protein